MTHWLIIGAAAASLTAVAAADLEVASPTPCDDPAVDPWVTDFRGWSVDPDGLVRFAIERFGEPVSCDGEVTAQFDGRSFGLVTLGFAGGATIVVETMPPLVRIVTLTSEAGFEDEAEIVAGLRAYTEARGMAVAWNEEPEMRTADGRVERQYWDPDPGLNGSATLSYVDGRLVSVAVSTAP